MNIRRQSSIGRRNMFAQTWMTAPALMARPSKGRFHRGLSPTSAMAFVSAMIGLGTHAFAQGCTGPNQQVIKAPPYQFTYESWVKPPGKSDSVYTFGACVANLGSPIVVAWDRAQLTGRLSLNAFAKAEFPWPAGTSRLVQTELKYGINSPPDKSVNVNLLVFEDRPDPQDTSATPRSEVSGVVEKWQTLLGDGKALEEAAKFATSRSTIPLSNSDGIIVADLQINFVSAIPTKFVYGYYVSYLWKNRGENVFEQAAGTTIRLTSEYLQFAVKNAMPPLLTGGSGDDFGRGILRLERKEGKMHFQYRNFRKPTMRMGRLDILQDERIIASVPVSFYQPSEF